MRGYVFLLLVMLLAAVTDVAFAAPKIEVEQTTFNFGEIAQGDKVKHSFVFTNAGDEDLQIKRTRSSCGCTAALVSNKTLAPGESGEVQATFDSTRFGGDITKTITLYSNDPVMSTLKLFIKAHVLKPLVVNPDRVNFGAVPPGLPV
ncbi:MAG: DUF1573 domain-containing protein, partial [Desulfuromonadales bacterium]|nr:DUF1573 domain-containing protein [Desulfuromonadales bacterium]